MKALHLALLLILATACTESQSAKELDLATNSGSGVEALQEDTVGNDVALESSSTPEINSSAEVKNEFPKSGQLIAEQSDAQIILRSQPSTTSQDKGYGLVGDTVTILNSTKGEDGFTWHYVRFDNSRAEGWIRGDLISVSGIDAESASASSSTAGRKVFPKLSAEQENQLLKIDEDNSRGIEVKIVLPTYVPAGFDISEFEIEDDPRFGPRYTVLYRDEQNNCFEFSAASGGFGADSEDFEIVSVDSKALGQVSLGFIQFDAVTSQPRIEFEKFNVPGKILSPQQYSFWSPTNAPECKAIDFQEAIKIVESLEYLNP